MNEAPDLFTTPYEVARAILSNQDKLAAAVKEAARESIRDVLTVAKVDGPVHEELNAMVSRTEQKLDTYINAAMTKLVAVIEHLEPRVEKKVDTAFGTFDITISRAVNDWLHANARQVIRATISQFLTEHPPSYTIIRDVKLMPKPPEGDSPVSATTNSPRRSRKARSKSRTRGSG